MDTILLILSLASTTVSLDLPNGLLSSVCYIESTHDPKAYSPNDGGSSSIGACQIKLATARLMGFKGTAGDLQSPPLNTYYAGLYLRYQLRRYDGNVSKAISAYNAGTYRVDDLGKIRNTLYVSKVLLAWKEGR